MIEVGAISIMGGIGYFSIFLSTLILSIIGCIKKINRFEKIWFCSKILTLKQIILDNFNNTYPFESISSENIYKLINKNYSYLLIHSTKEDCEPNFKKCGILDTSQNIMCIPQLDICPINEIKANLTLNSYNYKKFNYYDNELYFSNESVDNNIITKLIISDEKPKFINVDNFIFDEKTFLEGESSSNDVSDDAERLLVNDNKDAFIFYGNRKLTNYILKKFNEDLNIDKSYRNFFGNIYSRNYIGFDNVEEINMFINTDFSYNYKKKFPNTAAIVFGYLGIFFIFIYFSSAIKDKNMDGILCLIFIYIAYFLGYFIYFIKIFVDLYKKDIKCVSLKNIKTEQYIKDFINTFCDDNNYKITFLFALITIFSCSFFLSITSIIASFIDWNCISKCNCLKKNKEIKKEEIPEKQNKISEKPNLTYDTSQTEI